MKLNVTLPNIIEVDDYHEFAHIQNYLREIFEDNKFKITESGFYNGKYIGVVYYSKIDNDVKNLIEFVKSESKKWDEEWCESFASRGA